MFGHGNLREDLPNQVKAFIDKHNIQIINNSCGFNGGADHIFSFLFKGATVDVICCAYQNVLADKRFSQPQKEELRKLITDLLQNGTYKVREVNVDAAKQDTAITIRPK
jgi:hypothetical protein